MALKKGVDVKPAQGKLGILLPGPRGTGVSRTLSMGEDV